MRVANKQQTSQVLALLPGVDFEPILIKEAGQDRAVVLSAQQYEKMAGASASREFMRISESVSARVEAAGVTEEQVAQWLAEYKAGIADE